VRQAPPCTRVVTCLDHPQLSALQHPLFHIMAAVWVFSPRLHACCCCQCRWALVKPIPTRPQILTRGRAIPPHVIARSLDFNSGGWEQVFSAYKAGPMNTTEDGLKTPLTIDIPLQQNKVRASVRALRGPSTRITTYMLCQPEGMNRLQAVGICHAPKCSPVWAPQQRQCRRARAPRAPQWQLRLEPEDGWVPAWRAPLIAVVVVVSVLLSLLLAMVLVSRAQHKQLLHVLVPRNVLRELWAQEETWGKGPEQRWLESGTPASKILSMVTGLLEGQLPSTQDALLVRTAILQAWDLYQPVGGWLEQQMAEQDLDVSVGPLSPAATVAAVVRSRHVLWLVPAVHSSSVQSAFAGLARKANLVACCTVQVSKSSATAMV
jgi:hypothetical protein